MGSESHVSRWGGSLAVRIPRQVTENGGVREGALVEPEIRNDEVILRKRRFELNELVAGITVDNRHAEMDLGTAQGAEAWRPTESSPR